MGIDTHELTFKDNEKLHLISHLQLTTVADDPNCHPDALGGWALLPSRHSRGSGTAAIPTHSRSGYCCHPDIFTVWVLLPSRHTHGLGTATIPTHSRSEYCCHPYTLTV